jgi:hypothetical protein
MPDPVPDDAGQFIPQPPSEELVIWRYMDFTRFVSLLETRSLYFVRIACLDDPFEGSFPVSQTPLNRILEILPQNAFPEGVTVTVTPSPGLLDSWSWMRNWTMASCWHAVAHESAAMWKLYAPTNAGVAIRSTVGGLRKALGAPPPCPVGFFGGDQFHIGMVDYVDYASFHIPISNAAAPFFRKRRSFEHERELRALFMRWPINSEGWVDYTQQPNDHGMTIPVDLKVLVSEVRVAPQAPQWYSELVAKVVLRYGLEIETRQSGLDAKPLY